MGKVITDSPIEHKEGILSHPEGVDLLPANIELSGNLVLVTEAIHILIHATLQETIQKYLNELQLNKKQLEKLNKLRKLAGTPVIA